MDGSDHSRISSPTPVKRSSTPKPSSSGTDENDQSHQQMGISLQNSKKPMTKNFMSSTISASSKAVAPKRKILAERNEISDTNIQQNQNIDKSESSFSLNSDSSLSSYDPLTNYLSPRPKFLRYKPNRRRDIVLSSENEAKGKLPLPFKEDKEVGLVCASQDCEEIDEVDEEVEEEEEDEEKEGFLRRALKLMLVLLVLVSSTIYISLMNSPEVSSHTLQAKEGLKYGYLKIHDHVYGAMRRVGRDDHFLKRLGFKEILKKLEVGNEYSGGILGFMKVNQTVIIGECIEEEMVEDVYKGEEEEITVNLSEVVELEAGDGEVFDQMDEKFVLKVTESLDKAESLIFTQMPAMSNAFEEENEYVLEPATEVNNVGDGDLEMFESEMTEIEYVTGKAYEVFMADKMGTEIEILNLEADGKLKEEGLVEQIEIDILFKAVIGIATGLAVTALLILTFKLKRRRNATKDSYSISKPCTNQAAVAEKRNSILPNEREEHMRSADSFASPPICLINSTVEECKEVTQSLAPAVELLGEFVVGEISSSFRSRAMKSKMEEREVSNYSASLDKGFDSSKAYGSVPNHALLDFSELSVINISSSYEEFTPQKKKMKKEVGRDGEVSNVSTTPVRRSSRIRNRAITSP